MYNYRAPNSRTPEEFTENARKKVLNDLISSKLSSNFSHIRYHQDQCDSFVKSQRNPLQHQTHQQQVEIQGKERHVANHNDSKDLSITDTSEFTTTPTDDTITAIIDIITTSIIMRIFTTNFKLCFINLIP
ncbi:unnamed protein product [[Candida] boidinii]|nr:unnamed protein product [[Candida] boidinii]